MHGPDPDTPERSAETKTGYVTLMGRPNGGKSTLLNRLVGERLSIVTPKAQTTWQRVTGIRTKDATQMIFLDTPGLLDARDLFQRAMLGEALAAIHEADVLLLLLDPTRPGAARERREAIMSAISEATAPLHVAVNKVDEADAGAVEAEAAWARRTLDAPVHLISASTGAGVDELVADLARDLPPGPFLYPPDDLASEPVRFFVAEMVRETIFEQYHEEIPYSVFCQVEEYREDQDPLYIHVNVYVERESQKRVLIGARGRAVRQLGQVARGKIEHFLGRRVYLDLWIKHLRSWRRNRAHLRELGFHVPEADGSRP